MSTLNWPRREYTIAPLLSRATKKPRPWIAASRLRPVASTLPPRLIDCVVEPTYTPPALPWEYAEAKLARPDLKP
ncbi:MULTISPECIES: hypothetical protein [unclassified Pseudoxanthomonas]|uniref:hypothetical protein n=1 Tax=Pseudoxanthomonas sp. SGT-18 TaxID=2493087 RepID=UPI001E52ACFE|nr:MULTISPECIES: hypothetical protein [unclassified Pseudoxanthomonas]